MLFRSNATAPWLLALYVALAEERGLARATLAGTTQNDILKEYLARGTYIFPPAPSLKLTGDVIAFTCREAPKWNPVNVCSYHLQEAGATPVQELAFALANAMAVLDAVQAAGQEMLRERINDVLNTLTFREREIIKLRYGIGDGYTYTLEEVGRIFRVTRERVRQIEAKAVRKLRHPVRARQLSSFLDGSQSDHDSEIEDLEDLL